MVELCTESEVVHGRAARAHATQLEKTPERGWNHTFVSPYTFLYKISCYDR